MVHGVESSSGQKRKWIFWIGAAGWLVLIGGFLIYLTQAIHDPKMSQQPAVISQPTVIQQPVTPKEKLVKAKTVPVIPFSEPRVAPVKIPVSSLLLYQVGAFGDEAGAKLVQKRIIQLGLPVRLVSGKEAKPLIHVIVGPLKPEQYEGLKKQGFQMIVWEK